MKHNIHLLTMLFIGSTYLTNVHAQCEPGLIILEDPTLNQNSQGSVVEFGPGTTTTNTSITGAPVDIGQGGGEVTFFKDVTGDGKADIVFVRRSSGLYAHAEIITYPNLGNNAFGAAITTPIDRPSGGVANAPVGINTSESAFLADVNNDSYLDYVHVDDDANASYSLVTYFGNGAGKFTSLTAGIPGSPSVPLAVGSSLAGILNVLSEAGPETNREFYLADVTGDGNLDYVGTDNEYVGVWVGDGMGNFTANTSATIMLDHSSTDIWPAGVYSNKSNGFADVDGDGDLDYVHVSEDNGASTPTGAILVYINDPSAGTVNKLSTVPVVTQITNYPDNNKDKFAGRTDTENFSFYDYNGDGRTDYVVHNDGTFAYYLGKSDGTFETTPTLNVTSTDVKGGIGDDIATFVECVDAQPLPVELTTFTGEITNDAVQLNWTTISETNNAGFEVQRSYSGDDWKTLAFVDGHGSTSEEQTYSYQDHDALATNVYYRLKQVDFDGQAEYSHVVVVNAANLLTEVNVYPNPVSDRLSIIGTTGTASIYSTTGQLISTHELSSKTNLLDLSNLRSGFYKLVIRTVDGAVINQSLVK